MEMMLLLCRSLRSPLPSLSLSTKVPARQKQAVCAITGYPQSDLCSGNILPMLLLRVFSGCAVFGCRWLRQKEQHELVSCISHEAAPRSV